MIANLSHELRTPLTGIYGMALTLAEVGFDDQDFSAEITNIIIGEAAELSRMVDDLLTSAKVEAGDIAMIPEPIDPESLVSEVLVPFLRNRHIPCKMVPGTISADPLRLKQVLRNLISNAIKHGGPHIAITGQLLLDVYLTPIFHGGWVVGVG